MIKLASFLPQDEILLPLCELTRVFFCIHKKHVSLIRHSDDQKQFTFEDKILYG